MSSSLKYETPENVGLEYRIAGPGTRFVAWFIDNIILNVLLVIAFIFLVIIAAVSDSVLNDMFESMGRWADETSAENEDSFVWYFIGIGILLWGFGSFLYFSCCELWLRGQTYGKRVCKIRVVKSEGFGLDAPSILLRNLFRVIDHLPILWLVPLLSPLGRRLGDMAAGTVVISDEPEQLSPVRQQLAARTATDARFRFDYGQLGKLTAADFEVVEQVLDRWPNLAPAQREPIVTRLVGSLCKKMNLDEPSLEDRQLFLEDLLAAEYRRQDRRLK